MALINLVGSLGNDERFAIGWTPCATSRQHLVNGRRPGLALIIGKLIPLVVPQIIHIHAFARQIVGIRYLRSIPLRISRPVPSLGLRYARTINGNPGFRAAHSVLLSIDRFPLLRIIHPVKAHARQEALAQGIQALVIIHELAGRVNVLLCPRQAPLQQTRIRILAL